MESKYVETVLGPVNAANLGRVLTHEHLALDFEKFYVAPPSLLQEFLSNKINLGNVGVLKQYPYSSMYNVHFNDDESKSAVLEDVQFYKKCGGGTIVENTSHGIERNIDLMKEVSKKSGVHVIAGTGHYVAITQNKSSLKKSEEEMCNLMRNELTIGCGEALVKCGFIGEVGSSWPIEGAIKCKMIYTIPSMYISEKNIADFEKRAIRATARVQEELKCPVSFHPGRDAAAPFEILRIYMEAGGDVNKAIMSHLDRTLTVEEELLEFAKLGCYCQFDLFGIESSYYQLHIPTDMPSDAQRIKKVKLLKDEGKLDKILMSHDIHTKHRLLTFGGHGYAHILNNVLPKMLVKGFTKQEIDTITMKNPRTWLSA